MALKLRRIAMLVVVLAIVGILIFAFVIPQGLSGGTPKSEMTVYVQDVGTGDVFSASVDVGQPTNQLSVLHPLQQLKPLQQFDQTLQVYSTHIYKVWVTTSFVYSGDKIKSYDKAEVIILATSGASGYYLLNEDNMKGANIGLSGGTPTADEFKLKFTQSPVGTPPIDLGMSSTKPYFGADTLGGAGWGMYLLIYGSPQTHHEPPVNGVHYAGIGIEGITFSCTVNVYGTSNEGTAITGTVTATLVLHADTSISGGAISVEVKSMGASIS